MILGGYKRNPKQTKCSREENSTDTSQQLQSVQREQGKIHAVSCPKQVMGLFEERRV